MFGKKIFSIGIFSLGIVQVCAPIRYVNTVYSLQKRYISYSEVVIDRADIGVIGRASKNNSDLLENDRCKVLFVSEEWERVKDRIGMNDRLCDGIFTDQIMTTMNQVENILKAYAMFYVEGYPISDRPCTAYQSEREKDIVFALEVIWNGLKKIKWNTQNIEVYKKLAEQLTCQLHFLACDDCRYRITVKKTCLQKRKSIKSKILYGQML